MPSFEDMQKHRSSVSLGEQLKESSNAVMDEVFDHYIGYQKNKIYDCNMKEIQEIEFVFHKTSTYTISKDQVEYMLQFRPGVNPEVDFDETKDGKHRLSFYVDVYDENTKETTKWLIVGKDKTSFDRYNILKCNWTFEWLDDDRKYHSCLGVLRDRNNYNSGVWSDDFSTAIQNQTAFIVPNTQVTKLIDYGHRFMITDNEIHPKVWEITKLMDTFPLGNIKAVLSQVYYNEHTDLCEEIDVGDGQGKIMHMICDYKKSTLPTIIEDKPITSWSLSDVNDTLYVNGQAQVIYATANSDVSTTSNCEWHVSIDNTIYDIDELSDYFDIRIDDAQHALSIMAINKVMAKYIVKISIYDDAKSYYDFVEMEVSI